MAELMMPGSGRCTYFFLYDGSKVKGECDLTREGICYFYPEKTPIDKQELLCGQLAGVGRCVSELSSSPVRVLRLRHSKFAIKMEEDFFWALGCSMDFPTVSMCDLLDQLINLFFFYNGPIRQSYQKNSRETLALCWSQYLFYLQTGSMELHHIFSCLHTIDSTHIDPLLLLKAALILQACQRCPLVLAGCILFRGKVVSTQMPPALTVRVMARETQTYNKDERPEGVSSSSPHSRAVTSTTVHLTLSELEALRSPAVDRDSRSHVTPGKESGPRRTRLSRTLSDTPSTDSTTELETHPPHTPVRLEGPTSPVLTRGAQQGAAGTTIHPLLPQAWPRSQEITASPNKERPRSDEEEDEENDLLEKSCYHSFHSQGGNTSQVELQGQASLRAEAPALENKPVAAVMTGCCTAEQERLPDGMVASRGSGDAHCSDGDALPRVGDKDRTVVPMTLYQHRVKGLVLALLVEPHLQRDMEAMDEVYHSSLASLNGLEAHLRTGSAGPAGPQGPYSFAHYDCIQNTLTTNVSGRVGGDQGGEQGGDQDHTFIRATALLHTHFCRSEALQEAIIRSSRTAVYASRSAAQETYFLQHGGALRNSGVPNHRDAAFSLPSKARHALQRHGLSLL